MCPPQIEVIKARSRPQVQVLATLGSLSGISYPSRVQAVIGVAKLANLDLVRSASTVQQAFRCRLEPELDVRAWLRSSSGSTSSGLQRAIAQRLLHKQHCALPLADGPRALHCGHSRIDLGLAADSIVHDAMARRSRLLRPRSPQADECIVL